MQYFKRSPVVSSFPEDFWRIESSNIWLPDGHHYTYKQSSNGTKIVCSSFGLISVLLHQKHSSGRSALLREFLNKLDLSIICGDKESEVLADRSVPCGISKCLLHCQIRYLKIRLWLWRPQTVHRKVHSLFLQTWRRLAKQLIWTRQKRCRSRKWSSRVIKDVYDVCQKNRESLAIVLSNMCAFGDPDTKAIVNDIV